MLSQPLGTPDMAVPAQYSHFLQMWEFLENASGLQDGDFIVVQAPGVGSRGAQKMAAKCLGQPKPQAKPQCQQGACCRREGRVIE